MGCLAGHLYMVQVMAVGKLSPLVPRHLVSPRLTAAGHRGGVGGCGVLGGVVPTVWWRFGDAAGHGEGVRQILARSATGRWLQVER